MLRLAAGRVLYATTCQTCHGQDGKSGAMGGKALTTALGLADIVSVVTNGRNTMPPLGGVMPQTEIQDVAAYLVNELLPANVP